MNIVIEGRTASIIYTPWFNRILTGIFFLVSFVMAVWVAYMLPGMDEVRADLMRTFQTFSLFIAAACLLALFLLPSKAYVFDKGQGRGVFAIQQKYLFGTVQKKWALSEISHAEADRVKGNGPEAYWLRLILKSGKKIKFKPIAFTPEKTRAALEAIEFGLAAQGGVAPSAPVPVRASAPTARPGFGRRREA